MANKTMTQYRAYYYQVNNTVATVDKEFSSTKKLESWLDDNYPNWFAYDPIA